jgi:DNA-binding MarR family transcriptional regulator
LETDEISTAVLAALLEQMARRLHSQGYASHLFPAQWAALRYVQLAAPERRTAIDLARFQGLASGAVARTVRTLITKGYLVKRGTIGRGRAEQLELTDRGLALLKKDPLRKVADSLACLGPEERQTLVRSLETAIKATKSGEVPALP